MLGTCLFIDLELELSELLLPFHLGLILSLFSLEVVSLNILQLFLDLLCLLVFEELLAQALVL